jgi:hypothetical protein
MSVMDMNSRMAMAEKLSVQQLQQAIQSGSLPAYIGIPLIEQKNKEKSQMAAAQQGQQKPPSVAASILQQAEQGVTQLPSNLPEQGMAGGGIVAFAEGGDADDFDVEAYREQEAEDEYAGSLSALIAAAQAAAEEGVSTKKKGKKYADGGIARLNAGGLGGDFLEPVDFGAELDRAREISAAAEDAVKKFGTMGASGNPEDFKAAREALLKSKEREKLLQGQYELNMANSPEARPANYTDVLRARPTMNGGRNVPSLPSVPYSPPSAAPMLSTVNVTPANASPEPIPQNTEDMDITRDTGMPGGALPNKGIANLPAANTANPAVPGAPQGKMNPTALVNQVAEQTGRPRGAYDDFLDEIKAGREELKTQAQKDKYMAMIAAGLGMMSGTSPNAFANIGQGAQAGVASYMASGKQRAAEKAALNKNLLMGRRYQSMEDVANRTADINERRYAAIAAARGAGGDNKADELARRQINDIGRLAETRYRTLSTALDKARQDRVLDEKGYQTALANLNNDPELNRYNTIVKQLTNKMYGLSEETPAPSGESGGTRLKVDKNGNIIQ